MPRRLAIFLLLLLLLPGRLPAPIQEEDKPPPPQQEEAKPKAKRTKKSETSETTSTKPAKSEPSKAAPLTGPARFAGTWSGKISQGLAGHVASSITINAAADSVELSHNLGGGSKKAKLEGDSLTWHTGIVGEVSWNLTPNSDGQTAQVTCKGLLVHDTQTFRRGQITETTTTAATPAPKTIDNGNNSSVAGGTVTGPRPVYSPEARKQNLRGTGSYLLHFDPATGNVTDVTVTQSTGSALLDQAAITAFRQWHGPPGKKDFPVTISFP